MHDNNIFFPYLIIALTALAVNIPLGYVREKAQKFSLPWFFWIHASIPLLVYLRITLKTSAWFIPPAIALAVMGQIIGSRVRRQKMTNDDMETYQRIPDLGLIPKAMDATDNTTIIVLMNMGGPKTNADVKDFLRRIFEDPIILRFPLSRILQPLFAWLLVTLRTKATQERYHLIGGGSPIYDSTLRQAQALQAELKSRGHDISVTFVFNYSDPLPETVIEMVKTQNKKYVLPLSLYPHYSKATTGSNLFYLKQAAQKLNASVNLIQYPSYHLHEGYIKGIAQRIQEQVKSGESLDEFYLLFSAHGLPLYFLTEGDTYPFLISQTIACVLTQLKRQGAWSICYQSAVGPLEWIKPQTDEVLLALARRGIKKVIVVPISFVTDHIETLAEIDIEYRDIALKAGIKDFRMSRALECHPGFIQALADTVESALKPVSLSTINNLQTPVLN